MKLKEFLKQFEGLDTELEVGIHNYSHFISEIVVEKQNIEDGKHFPVFTMGDHGKEIIVISSK
jgi:hypothetical protein